MRKFIISILLALPIMCFAGRTTLADGKTSAYWEDRTSVVNYGSYRLDIKLTSAYTKNVWGSAKLYANGKCVGSKNFMIKAGELKCSVDFDNLPTGARYDVVVTVSGK